jgi:thioredoxin 2
MAIITCARCGTKNRVDESVATARQPVCGKCGAALVVRGGADTVDTSRPLTVTDASFEREVLQAGNRPVVLDCWAPWCGPCRMVAPILDQLAAESGGRYIIGKLNVDENPQTASRYGVQSIPTLLIFKNGSLVDRMIGVQSKQAIAAKLK